MPRIIYSLLVEVNGTYPPPATTFLVLQLNRAGNCPIIQPCPPKTRVIDLRVGDWFLHSGLGKAYRVKDITAYREGWSNRWPTDDCDYGYVVRGS